MSLLACHKTSNRRTPFPRPEFPPLLQPEDIVVSDPKMGITRGPSHPLKGFARYNMLRPTILSASSGQLDKETFESLVFKL